MSTKQIGKVVQCIGAVVDVEFPRDQMPRVYDALIIEDKNSTAETGLTLEVQQQLGGGVVRTIAMGSSDGLRRGLEVVNSGSPITVPVASLIGGGFGWVFGGKGADVLTGADKPKTPVTTSPATPQSPVIPSSTKPPTTAAVSDKPFEQQMDDLKSQASSIDFTQAPQYGEVNITPEEGNQVSSQPSQVNIKPLLAQTDRVSTQVNIGPAPAPAPNVIYRRVGSSAQQRSGAAPTGGPVNQVPSISASNPDNFYVLYSQVNYNVVT